MPLWVEVLTLLGGLVGAVGGVIGAIGGIRGHRAKRVATEARARATEIADSALRLELERRHDDLAPPAPTSIHADRKDRPRLGDGSASLQCTIEVPRDYRVRVEALSGSSARKLNLPLLLRGGRPYTFEIEQWPPGREMPVTEELRFRFWPPNDIDEPAERWTCHCGRPMSEKSDQEPGHWGWTVSLEYYDPVASIH
jgi:hypothetical protein